MDKQYSYKALMEFLEYVENHGLWKANTAVGYRSAASKVAGDLTEQEADDVRQIDLDLLFQRFMNRNRVKVSPGTLATYKQRLQKAIGEFQRYREDPIGYKPSVGGGRSPSGDGGSRSAKPARKRPVTEPAATTPSTAATPSGPSGTQMLNIPFPLRPDFLASVQVPRDLKKTEADRLAAFIKALAVDSDGS